MNSISAKQRRVSSSLCLGRERVEQYGKSRGIKELRHLLLLWRRPSRSSVGEKKPLTIVS